MAAVKKVADKAVEGNAVAEKETEKTTVASKTVKKPAEKKAAAPKKTTAAKTPAAEKTQAEKKLRLQRKLQQKKLSRRQRLLLSMARIRLLQRKYWMQQPRHTRPTTEALPSRPLTFISNLKIMWLTMS